eukprot:TRINITY_DN6596_c0_g1_i2.p1 TRINITY_DN6596_c0_g1~~TRINITY_DN6596_c0_g1_i2.p1  ORF type:complete len:728 (+),score=182.35 TRINITY_DN6596_c0_g1_i2:67-2184(+)
MLRVALSAVRPHPALHRLSSSRSPASLLSPLPSCASSLCLPFTSSVGFASSSQPHCSPSCHVPALSSTPAATHISPPHPARAASPPLTLPRTATRACSFAALSSQLHRLLPAPASSSTPSFRGFAKKKKGSKKQEKSTGPPKKSKGEGDPSRFVFRMEDVTKVLPNGDPLFNNLCLSAYYGAKIGIVGINGSGKSSLMKIIAGVDEDYDGDFRVYPSIKVGYFEQEPTIDENLNVWENVISLVKEDLEQAEELQSLEAQIKAGEVDEEELEEVQERVAELKQSLREKGTKNVRKKAAKAMVALRCPPPDSPTAHLSGGERRRIALARVLISQPDLLLLDEPTNHLDAESVAWLENFLAGFRGTVIAITHDRYFLDNVAGWILELDRGDAYPHRGNYTSWIDAKIARLDQEKRTLRARDRQMKAERAWASQSQKGRQAKSKARLDNYEQLCDDIRSRRRAYQSGTIVIPPGPRLGEKVIEACNLTKSVDDRVLFENVSFALPAGAILGIVGPNGTGKSTLFRILTGEVEADSGEVIIGETVDLGYVSQTREFDGTDSVFEAIAEGVYELDYGAFSIPMRSFVAAFNFVGPSQQKPVSTLSGGERNRAHLAKMLKRGPNVLLLDEPSNDLDVEVLRNLENAIMDFEGAAAIVSHDRWFLDRLCTHILAFEGDSNVVFHEGNYTEYEEDRRKRLGTKNEPSQLTFRRL